MNTLQNTSKYTKEYLKQLNKKVKMIPLTSDFAFKSVMLKNTDIFKKFLIETMNLKVNLEDSRIIFLDKELIKENYKEKGKTVDFNVKIGENLLITVEVNKYDFELVKKRNQLFLEKLHSMQFEVGEEYKVLKSKYLYQLNLNAKDDYKNVGENVIVSYDVTNHSIYNDNLKIYIKHLEYYKDMFYTNHELMKYDEIFMAGMLSENFTELYQIMSCILSEHQINRFMESVVNMSKEYINIHEWAKEEMDKLVREEAKNYGFRKGHEEGLRHGREEGMEEGMEKGIEQKAISMIKNLLKKNMPYEDIAEVSEKSIDEIKKIEESMQQEKY